MLIWKGLKRSLCPASVPAWDHPQESQHVPQRLTAGLVITTLSWLFNLTFYLSECIIFELGESELYQTIYQYQPILLDVAFLLCLFP